MKQYNIVILVIGLSTLVLLGCRADDLTYEEGFPEEDSEGLTEFMAHYLFGNNNYLLKEDEGTYIYADRNGNTRDDSVTYFKFTKEQLQDYYSPLFTSEDPKKTMNELFDSDNSNNAKESLHQQIHDLDSYSLPKITKDKGTVIIETSKGQKKINLAKLDKQIKDENDIRLNLIKSNEAGLILYLEDFTTEQKYYLFALQDMKNIILQEDTKLDEAIKNGDMERYYSLLDPIGETEKYVGLPNRSIVDVTSNSVHHVKSDDKRSKKWDYIYLNGSKKELTDGTQKIQSLDNYLKGNEVYEAEFDISFKKIAKKSGIKTSGAGITKIYYFDEDLVMLSLNYDGVLVGNAGFINVIIDLKDSKESPTGYLVDLDLLQGTLPH